jgi:hypothetical protein
MRHLAVVPLAHVPGLPGRDRKDERPRRSIRISAMTTFGKNNEEGGQDGYHDQRSRRRATMHDERGRLSVTVH